MNSTQLQANISSADIASIGTAQVSVTTPQPGGVRRRRCRLRSTPANFGCERDQRYGWQFGDSDADANGLGGGTDWLGLATRLRPTTELSAIHLRRGWRHDPHLTVTMPTTAGLYEFRLFPNNGYVLAASSPMRSRLLVLNPVPVIGSLTPSSGPVGGPAFTLSVNGSGFVSTSTVRWNGANRPTTFVNSTLCCSAVIPASGSDVRRNGDGDRLLPVSRRRNLVGACSSPIAERVAGTGRQCDERRPAALTSPSR